MRKSQCFVCGARGRAFPCPKSYCGWVGPRPAGHAPAIPYTPEPTNPPAYAMENAA